MSRYIARQKFKTWKCPKCGMHHNEWIYVYRNGACARTFSTMKGAWAYDKNAYKCRPTYRVERVDKEWMKHRTNPAWKDNQKILSCCVINGVEK